jgi:hypothetical protein
VWKKIIIKKFENFKYILDFDSIKLANDKFNHDECDSIVECEGYILQSLAITIIHDANKKLGLQTNLNLKISLYP